MCSEFLWWGGPPQVWLYGSIYVTTLLSNCTVGATIMSCGILHAYVTINSLMWCWANAGVISGLNVYVII